MMLMGQIELENIDITLIPKIFCPDDKQALECYVRIFNQSSCDFEPYKHKKFNEDLETDPARIHSSFFEMKTALFFKEQEAKMGLILQRTPSGNSYPDLLLQKGDKRFWIECIVPGMGDGEYSVPDWNTEKPHGFAINQSLLRITNALMAKKKQYFDCLQKGTIKEDDCYIIAISGDNLDSPEIPVIGVSAKSDIKRLLNGEFLQKNNNEQISQQHDFESGIINSGVITHDAYRTKNYKDTKVFPIKFWENMPKPKNIAVLYFRNSFPMNDACSFFCGQSELQEFLRPLCHKE